MRFAVRVLKLFEIRLQSTVTPSEARELTVEGWNIQSHCMINQPVRGPSLRSG